LLALLHQSSYRRLAGSEAGNDAQRRCLDPALRVVVGGRAKDHKAAATSELARFETATLSTTANLKDLTDLSGQGIGQAHPHRQLTKLILDRDSSVSATYGPQQGSAYHGHFACTCYHPLFLANSRRQWALPRSIRNWNLTTWRAKLVKIGAQVVSHSKYVLCQLAEVVVPRQLCGALLERSGRLRLGSASR
jgi:hypothetical protein